MADNIPITAGSGTTVATDDVGGVHYQVIKLAYGALDSATLATSSTPLPVAPVPANVISTANSTTSVLSGGAAFTGTSEDVSNYSVIHINVFASHASATDGLSLQQSSNGTNWDLADTYTVPAAAGRSWTINPAAQFFRLVYTNGGTLQTSFRLQTIYKRFIADRSTDRAGDAVSNEMDLGQMQGFGMVWNGATWDRMPGSAALGQTIKPAGSTTATLANVSSSASNVTLRAANTARLGLMMYNDSTSSCYVKFGATASATSFTVFLGPTAYYELPGPHVYNGIVDGIWVSANGNMRVSELT